VVEEEVVVEEVEVQVVVEDFMGNV